MKTIKEECKQCGSTAVCEVTPEIQHCFYCDTTVEITAKTTSEWNVSLWDSILRVFWLAVIFTAIGLLLHMMAWADTGSRTGETINLFNQ